MNRRALIIAAIFALLTVASFVLYRRRFSEEASGGEMIKIVVLAREVQPGEILDDEAISLKSVPRAFVEDRAIVEADKAKVIGLRAIRSLHSPQALLWSDLPGTQQESLDLSQLVQPGMRAVTIRVEGRAPSVRAGDHVDLIATLPRDRKAGQKESLNILGAKNHERVAVAAAVDSSKDKRSSVVLLQNVVVLGLGYKKKIDIDFSQVKDSAQQINQEERKKIGILSLSLTVQEVQFLSLAADGGKITVALRGPADQRVSEGFHDMPDFVVLDGKLRTAVQEVRRTGLLAQLDTTEPPPAAVPQPPTGRPAPPPGRFPRR